MINNTQIKELIENNDIIVIYRHVNSDYDAYGSQLGLKYLIKENYPEKQVYCVGDDDIINPPFIDPMDDPDEETLRKSLAMIVDTSNIARVETETYKLAASSIRIDHHPFVEQVAQYELIDTDASSACQLILELALDNQWNIPKRAAELLYGGISSDTVKISISKVDSRLYRDLAQMMDKAPININDVNRYVYDEDIDTYNKNTLLRTRFKFCGNFAYLLMSQEDLKETGITETTAKICVDLMGNIKGVDKYATFVQQPDMTYSASLRSHSITISDIAEAYGGGGHLLASGIANLSLQQVEEVIKLLIAKE